MATIIKLDSVKTNKEDEHDEVFEKKKENKDESDVKTANKLNKKNEKMEKENEALLEKSSERRDYDDDYTKLLQLKHEMVEKEKTTKPWDNKCFQKFIKSIGRDKMLLGIVVLLFLIIITSLIVIYIFHEEETLYIFKGKHLSVNGKSTSFELTNDLNRPVLSGEFWKLPAKGKLPYDCSGDESAPDDFCFNWKRQMKMSVASETWPALNLSCYKVSWTRVKMDLDQEDCFDMKESIWFGGGLLSDGSWPLNTMSFTGRPFVTGNSNRDNEFGGVLEKYWLSSNGVGIFIDESSDIEISINKKSPKGKMNEQFCLHSGAQSNDLSYTICVAPNMTHIHKTASAIIRNETKPFQNTTSINFNDPLWSTRRFKSSNFNQKNIQAFAKNISKFPHDTLLIEDGWEDVIGNLDFDSKKFHDVNGLIDSLHDLNFSASLAVHTYIEPKSPFFQEGSLKQYLLKSVDRDVPGLTFWSSESNSNEESIVAALELSSNATEWLVDRLKGLQEKYPIDSFHFISGSVSSLPAQPLHRYFPHDSNHYTRLHCEFASTLGPFTLVDTAYTSQDLEIIVKMTRRESTWNGLNSVIQSALSLSLAGYNLFLPEAAGGSIRTEFLSKELYIRWMQLNTFLPFMHFSISPDEFDEETTKMATVLSEFRSSYVTPAIEKFYRNGQDQQLLIRPVWWYSPEDKFAIRCNDEFVVGDKFLFAPILKHGARYRNIYLPYGIWEDKPKDIYYIGPLMISNYSVPLNSFAYFVKK